MITSQQNPKIQWVKNLQQHARRRREENALVVEGVRLVEEALASGSEPLLTLYTSGLDQRASQIVETCRLSGFPLEEVSPAVLAAASDTETPQGILMVIPQPNRPVPEPPTLVLIPDSIRDPGNMGTILRTADAVNADTVLIPPETVDVNSPKVLRSGMGAHFHLAIRELDWEGIHTFLEQHRLFVYLAEANASLPYTQADFHQPVAILLGGEAGGASPEGRALAHQTIHIPMPGKAESLNAAIAAGVILFEILRQRQGNQA